MYIKVKRYIDIILSLFGLVILSPVFCLLICAIRLESNGSVLFRQKRIGIDKQHFYILKFRTMLLDTPKDIPTHMLSNPEQYITRIGRLLRKTSMDELPQLINIVKGEMSIVGPRPALWNQFELIKEREQYGANGVTPGLTGWAQVHGRDELEIKEKARLDGYYVRNISMMLDIRCVLYTLISVLKSDGIVEGGTGEINRKVNRKVNSEQVKDEDDQSDDSG